MERKRLEEWEKQRKAELTEHRQREQDKLFALKARQENLNQELENLVSLVSNYCVTHLLGKKPPVDFDI